MMHLSVEYCCALCTIYVILIIVENVHIYITDYMFWLKKDGQPLLFNYYAVCSKICTIYDEITPPAIHIKPCFSNIQCKWKVFKFNIKTKAYNLMTLYVEKNK